MSDPKRWSEDDDAALRELVGSLKVEPSVATKDAVFEKVVGALAPAGGSVSPKDGGTPVATSISGAKLFLLVSVVAGAVGMGILVTRPSVDRPPPSPPVAPIPPSAPLAPSAEPVPSADREPDRPELAPSASSSSVPPPTRSARPPASVAPSASAAPSATVATADALREETDGVRRARRAVRDGDPRTALATLDALDRRIPAGALEEEREVLRIEALFAAHDPAATRRAERFLADRPGSVHVARIKTLLGGGARP